MVRFTVLLLKRGTITTSCGKIQKQWERRGAVLMPYFDLQQKYFFVKMQKLDFRMFTLCFKDVHIFKCECLDTHLTFAKLGGVL